MNNEMLESKAKQLLMSEGFDLIIGVAGIGLKMNFPPSSPELIPAEAKSAICFGMPIPKGILNSASQDPWLYWRYFNLTTKASDILANKLCMLLEQNGYTSIPAYGCYPLKTDGKRLLGGVPLIYWAEAAGMGRLSKCGMLVNQQWGLRILLGGVITTAQFAPTAMKQDLICPAECSKCIAACPVKAIDETGKVDHIKCLGKANANPITEHLLRDETSKAKYSFDDIMNLTAVDDHSTYSCFECVRACPLN